MKKMEALHIAKMYMEEGYQSYEDDEYLIQEEMINDGYDFEDIDKVINLFRELWDHAVYGGLY